MVYRQTEKVKQRLAARHAAIIASARDIAAEEGIAAVQIVPVAQRAGIAAGTIYRYFPGKTELVGAVVDAAREQDLAAMRTAADGAPGPISALAAAIVALAAGTIRHARLSWALLSEPADPDIAGLRLRYRQALTGELEERLRALPVEYHAGLDSRLAAAVIIGALLGGLVGPSTPETSDPARERELVQLFTLFALRGIGISDSRARGIIVQTPIVVQA